MITNKMRLILSLFMVFTPFLIACTHTATEAIADTAHATNKSIAQYWHLEWFAGFEPDTGIYEGTPFDWSRTKLKTDVADPANWSLFTAGCNGIGARQKRNVEGHLIIEVTVEQVGCTELICEGEGTREVGSRYSKIETLIAKIYITDGRVGPPLQVKLEGDNMTWLAEDGMPLAKFKKDKSLTGSPFKPLKC